MNGRYYSAYELTKYRLSEDAVDVLDEWIDWLLTGTLDPDGVVAMFRKGVHELGSSR